MATGSGKTFVAIMLILRIFEQDLRLRKQGKEELERKHDRISGLASD